MKITTPRSCLAGPIGLLALALPTLSSASVIEKRQQHGAAPWISVDSDGEAHTFTPTVTRSGGALTTIDPQPHSLTGTVFTVTASDGAESTTTMQFPPPPRATDADGGQGYFARCLINSNSAIAPFCAPRDHAELRVDEPYYITWDVKHFAGDGDTNCRIRGFAVARDERKRLNDTEASWTLGEDDDIKLSDGFHVWTPREKDLNGASDFSNFSIEINYVASSNDQVRSVTGAVLAVLPARDNEDDSSGNRGNDDGGGDGGGGVPIAAVVVPIVVVILGIVGIGAWLLIRRRRRDAAAANVKRVSSGFSNRTGDVPPAAGQKATNDIQLEDRSPTSPGSNVFQEEMARQNRERSERP